MGKMGGLQQRMMSCAKVAQWFCHLCLSHPLGAWFIGLGGWPAFIPRSRGLRIVALLCWL